MIYTDILDKEIREFGGLFFNRLDNELLQDAINYINYDERRLAFETICDHISEYDIPITIQEYEMAIGLCGKLHVDANDVSIKHLKKLIACG